MDAVGESDLRGAQVNERGTGAAPNDKERLVPSLAAVVAAAGPVADVLIDSGFVSEAAVGANLQAA